MIRSEGKFPWQKKKKTGTVEIKHTGTYTKVSISDLAGL